MWRKRRVKPRFTPSFAQVRHHYRLSRSREVNLAHWLRANQRESRLRVDFCREPPKASQLQCPGGSPKWTTTKMRRRHAEDARGG
jgi:hypothetical protein